MGSKTICNKCGKSIRNCVFKKHYNVCGVFNNCLQCGSKIPRENKFCNNKCSATYNNKNSEKWKKCKKGGISSTSFKPKNPETYVKPDKTERECLYCKKPTRNKKYCCLDCGIKHKSKTFEEMTLLPWLNKEAIYKEKKYFMKKYLLKINNNSCSKCGWNELHPVSKECPLHMHHKDGNYYNNFLENLELLCPNCHSLTENFGSRNIGKGHPESRKYWTKYYYENRERLLRM